MTCLLDSFPGYRGGFPIRVFGLYMNNPAAAHSHQAWSFGPVFGRTGRKGQWEIGYRWKHLEGDAWYEEFVDDDFGAIYKMKSVLGAAGFRSGTNVRGHIVRAAFSPTDSLELRLSYYNTELINSGFSGSRGHGERLLFDAMWRF